MTIFSKEENIAKDNLIKLYERFLKNPKDNSLISLAEECDYYIGPAYSPEVIEAVSRIKFISGKEIQLENPKEILNILKK